MQHKKRFSTPHRITVMVEKEYVEYLRLLAIQKSSERGIMITPSELIREAMESFYPYSPNGSQESENEKLTCA